jgi:hypothetical protein
MVMNETPYERKLLALANDARKAKDTTTLSLLENMIANVRAGQYGPLQCQFPYLLPSCRIRLGAPPNSREEDTENDGDPVPKR